MPTEAIEDTKLANSKQDPDPAPASSPYPHEFFFKNHSSVTPINCFSIFRTIPKLFSDVSVEK